MKNFKQSILAISLAFGVTVPSMACGWDSDPSHYDLFQCVKEIPYLEQQRLDESINFWINYLGGPDNVGLDIRNGVEYMRPYHFEDNNEDNDLVMVLRRHNDQAALEFLRLNMELRDLTNTNAWDYKKPSPQQLQNLLSKIDHLKTTGALTQRKTFLKMRCLYALKDYTACLRLWDNFASQWDPSPLRDRFEGYIAGIQFQKGNYDEALPLYFKQGDGESIRLCVNRMLESTSIEREYEKDPNALILGYILEDYANYFYHAKYDSYWTPGEEGYPIWTKVVTERDKVLQLAERVVKEGKARDLQMWQAFIGFVQMTSGQNDEAYESFCKAEKLRGNGVVKPLIRDYKFCANLGRSQQPKNMDAIIVEELKHEKQVAQSDNKALDVERGVLYSLYDDLLYNRIDKYFEQKNEPTMRYLSQVAMHSWDIWKIDNEYNTDQVKEIRNAVLTNGGGNPLYRDLVSMSGVSADRLTEMVGTKLIREGKFAEAATYLEQVSHGYIAHQNITPYLMCRPMFNTKPFMRVTYDEVFEVDSALVENRKLQFCQQAVEYQQQAEQAINAEQRAQAYYDLAKLLFHGSAAGDWWAISQYSHSSYADSYNELDDLAADYLRKALAETKTELLKGYCYFGLAATPTSPEENTYVAMNIKAASIQQYNGYQKLLALPHSHPIYGMCDWLDLYISFDDAVGMR